MGNGITDPGKKNKTFLGAPFEVEHFFVHFNLFYVFRMVPEMSSAEQGCQMAYFFNQNSQFG
jgi:hypothetical protein